MRRFLLWAFQNRETGAITIAQAPNLFLWVVIIAALASWVFHPAARIAVALTIVIKGGLLLWAMDEVLRGVNPWRRSLGAAVLAYEVATLWL